MFIGLLSIKYIKVYILMSKVNETIFLVQYESCECNCGFNESICNSKQNGVMMNVGVSVKN